MQKKALLSFLDKEIEDAKNNNILLSLHMKATMMKYLIPLYLVTLLRPTLKMYLINTKKPLTN